jgi:phenylpyruvate tautomerase PptA (4-oxalocrotonate tautomerase family)
MGKSAEYSDPNATPCTIVGCHLRFEFAVTAAIVSEARKRNVRGLESITDLMVDILGRSHQAVVVSVTSAARSDWSVAGAVQDGGGLAGVQAVVRVLTGTGSDEQKARMIEQTTDVLRRTLGNPAMPFYSYCARSSSRGPTTD